MRGGLKMKDKRMGKTGEVKEKAKRRQRWWRRLSLPRFTSTLTPVPASISVNSLPRAKCCLVPGRPGMCPQQLDSGPTQAPGQLLPPSRLDEGQLSPPQAQSEQWAPCTPILAPQAINHKWRCGGFPGPLPSESLEPENNFCLCWLHRQDQNSMKEIRGRTSSAGAGLLKPPSAPIGFNIKKPPRSLRHCIN